FAALLAASHFSGKARGPVLIVALVLTGLVWPHLAYFLARRAKDTKQAELRNLLLDSFIVGCWTAAMSFSLWPTLAILPTLLHGILAVGGFRFTARALGTIAAGVLVVGALLGFHPVFAADMVTTFLSIGGILLMTCLFGIHSYLQTSRVYKAKSELAAQNEQIQEQNRGIEQARQSAPGAESSARAAHPATSA